MLKKKCLYDSNLKENVKNIKHKFLESYTSQVNSSGKQTTKSKVVLTLGKCAA